MTLGGACSADSSVEGGGGEWGGARWRGRGRHPEGLSVRFCGRQRGGDQGGGRTDWAGPEPPGSPGSLGFNHSAAEQSDGEPLAPLVSLASLCLRLHLCLFSFRVSPPPPPPPPGSRPLLPVLIRPPLIVSAYFFLLPRCSVCLLFSHVLCRS